MIRKRTNYVRTSNKPPRNRFLMPFYNILDIYKFYRKSINLKKGEESKYNIKYKQVRDILDCYNKKLGNELVKGREVNLPNYLNTIQVHKQWFSDEQAENLGFKKADNLLASGRWLKKIRLVKHIARLNNMNFYTFKITDNLEKQIINNMRNGNHGLYYEHVKNRSIK